jgi:hypothetical protein
MVLSASLSKKESSQEDHRSAHPSRRHLDSGQRLGRKGLIRAARAQLAVSVWRTPMKAVVTILIVALGLVAGAVAPAHADHWPADLWSSLDRERF